MQVTTGYVLLVLMCGVYASNLSELSLRLLGQRGRRHKHRSRKADWSSFYQTVQNLPIRPSSSMMIPLDIQESPNKDLDPDLESLDEYQLLKTLGEDYDRQYMAIRKPLEMRLNPEGKLYYRLDKDYKQAQKEIPTEIQAISHREVKLNANGPSLRVRFSRKIKRKLQKFLWAYSYCPVRYKWKELSIRFWPRWIRVGTCDSTYSCSIPAGMTCQPSRMKNIKILRYYCPIKGSKSNCLWIKFEYPILDKCSCSCNTSQALPDMS